MAGLHDLSTWLPALDTLIGEAPGGVGTVEFTGTVTSVSVGGSHRHDGRYPRESASSREFFGQLRSVLQQTDVREIGVVLRAGRDGRREVDVIEPSDAVSLGSDGMVGDLRLVPGAVPALYRRQHGAGIRPTSPTADPAALTRMIYRRLPDATGTDPALLAATEAQLGVPLTDEVRALYLAASAGELVVDAEGGFYGMELIPLSDNETRSWFLAEARMSGWRFGAKETLGHDPQRKVAPLGATPLWFPVGHDWGGNAYAVDLTPDIHGHHGQVVFLDHELNAGAAWVGESFTDLLMNGREGDFTGPVRGRGTANVNSRNGVTLADAAAVDNLEVLSLGLLDAPADLSAVLGRPGIRTVTALPGTLADPRQIGRLPGLEYVSMGVAEWHTVISAGCVPPGLLAAHVAGGAHDLMAVVGVSNVLLAQWNRPPVRVASVR